MMTTLLLASTFTVLPEEYRTWTDRTGAYSCIAKFRGSIDRSVRLERFDTNRVVTVPLSLLSDADLQWLLERESSAIRRREAYLSQYRQYQRQRAEQKAAERRERIEARCDEERRNAQRLLAQYRYYHARQQLMWQWHVATAAAQWRGRVW